MRYVNKKTKNQRFLFHIAVLIATIFILFATFASGQEVTRPLPKLVQNLSDEDYAIWAQWQNRQAERHSEERAKYTQFEHYNYGNRIVTSRFNRGSASRRFSNSATAHSQVDRNSRSQFTNRHGSSNTTMNRSGNSVITAYGVRFLNPDYVGPGITPYYNPWVRPEGGLGTPDWSRIFIPCKEGTITMQEVLDRLGGPMNPEKVFEIMMEGYIGG